MEARPILSTLGRHKTAAALIVLEIALTAAIVCNALFLIGNRIEHMTEPSGVATEEIVRVQIASVGTDADAEAMTSTDLAALRAIPGVKAATAANQMPFVTSSSNNGVRLSKEQKRPTLNATTYLADEQFIDTLGLKIVAGRSFEPGEYLNFMELRRQGGNASLPSVLVTRSLAQALFPGENALGKVIYASGENPSRIIGIVDHLVRPDQRGGAMAHEFSTIWPVRVPYSIGGNYLLRTEPARRAEVLAAAKAVLRERGAQRLVIEEQSKTLSELRQDYYRDQRSMAWLLGGVVVALLVVTALGIVGLASFWVQQRTRQIGVRRALGATRGQILRYFQLENFILATAGIVIGMVMAFGINQLLMKQYDLPRLPWYYLPAGAAVLWGLGQLSVLWPARRAAAVPPAVATRSA